MNLVDLTYPVDKSTMRLTIRNYVILGVLITLSPLLERLSYEFRWGFIAIALVILMLGFYGNRGGKEIKDVEINIFYYRMFLCASLATLLVIIFFHESAVSLYLLVVAALLGIMSNLKDKGDVLFTAKEINFLKKRTVKFLWATAVGLIIVIMLSFLESPIGKWSAIGFFLMAVSFFVYIPMKYLLKVFKGCGD
ncbi:hypothetical protein [Aliidiomarina indica]|uniref:hypothetical protein n=1 Tax=Aliidiomarina indica TaxID=2749147 RepID=UPI00188E6B2B|nr:hypothetical protein [Aliidiomarina indica]